jgi:hypothetical protein
MTAHRGRRSVLTAGLLLTLAGCAGSDPSDSRAAATAAEVAPSSAPESPAGQHLRVQLTGGQASGDTGRVPVAVGTPVTLSITSDAADEVHVHGYDLEATLTPGTPAEISFDAGIPGVFEVELHEAGTVLLSLQVG